VLYLPPEPNASPQPIKRNCIDYSLRQSDTAIGLNDA
jgi:hypothetical protein